MPVSHSLRAYNAVVPESARLPAADIAAWYADPATLPRPAPRGPLSAALLEALVPRHEDVPIGSAAP